ncbi:1-deoxy-D-xylulose-5-phosphate synthase [Dethiosulfatarculus sandiegensis]|uniref:1-deoxy-D-xylulose-5-phosphate synthase n=1 Tax=Dethiosulfatarculus sandiegensis TaxID=1429043 RepID=A0A0D2GEH3_9BACT|nr:1-deoxy-D-xylulose-5-phosphate synthase [Dethiosulfatarculus sandiegensis]KIX13382.1 1-deoxy-D-xylulose-5-phosphate synthase [Dethiosulfatarculus sandiegensis]
MSKSKSETEDSVLKRVSSPQDLKGLTLDEMNLLARELRQTIISQVRVTGGHLAPSLGVVELTLALHKVFNLPKDKIVWDVGHQTYAHKILTGRKDRFNTLRQLDGISGFPKRSENPCDCFDTGHSSTSISAALGMAVGKHLQGDPGRVIAVIGDGSLTAGMAYEGLNQAGDLDEDLIVVLNDNGMSIAPNVGALNKFMSRALSGKAYQGFRKDVEKVLRGVPGIGKELIDLARRSEESLKAFSTPGMLFEAFKFNYLGPVDGHRLDRLTETFEMVKRLKGPVLVHVLTQKGRGYEPAELNPAHYHGVGAVKAKDAPKQPPSYTSVFGRTMVELAGENKNIIALTAAMPEGTGLTEFSQKYPERFKDVGIAEQHAVTFAAGLACEGYQPVVAIYSTFMQRAYDQVVHDVCLQNLPVVFALDRGGIVGEDGETHQGLLDISYMRCVPNMAVMAPADEDELRHMLKTALEHKSPVTLRYPRGCGLGAELKGKPLVLDWGKAELRREGSDCLLLGIGVGVKAAEDAAFKLQEKGHDPAVINARFAKPLDEELICAWAEKTGRVVTIEENVLAGGFGSAVLECLNNRNLLDKVKIRRVGVGDTFVRHGSQAQLRALYEVDADALEKAALELFD